MLEIDKTMLKDKEIKALLKKKYIEAINKLEIDVSNLNEMITQGLEDIITFVIEDNEVYDAIVTHVKEKITEKIKIELK